MAREPRKAEIILEYQNYIESPPIPPKQMYSNACSSDGVTIDTWRKQWLDQMAANKKRFGSFKDHSIGSLFGTNRHKSAIVIGSGPSLARNGHEIKDRKGLLAISCLHNYHFFEDRGIDIDYYVTLDAGDVVLEEVSEGGSKTADEYWASTKNKKLIAFVGTNPKLFEKWQGEVYFYNAPVPDESYMKKAEEIEKFNTFISNGGNVLGAAFYFAKGILGSSVIAFMGADFSFGYNKKFHAWDSKYDAKLGYVLKAVDVFGNKVLTWQSYFNFKNWFDYVASTVPGIYINCTEGGTFGAYPEGNIMSVKQMSVAEFLDIHGMSDNLKEQCANSETDQKTLLF